MRLGVDVSYLWNVGIKLVFQMGEDIMIVGIKSMFRMGALWEDIISVGVKSMLEWKRHPIFELLVEKWCLQWEKTYLWAVGLWAVGIKLMFAVGKDIFVNCWY